jgi:ubiquitin-conjugating enzyme E2 J2
MTSISRIAQKRLQSEQKMIQKDPLEFADAYPDEKDQLKWYCLIRGQKGTDYAGGFYILLIHHSVDYPAKAPDYYMYTPNGRFDINHKICLTNSSFHPESWSAIWNIRSLLEAFLSIMASDDTTGISHIKDTSEKRKEYAKNSFNYNITHHKSILANFPRFVTTMPDKSLKMKSDDELDKEYKEISDKNKKKLVSKNSKSSNNDDNKDNNKDKSKDDTNNAVVQKIQLTKSLQTKINNTQNIIKSEITKDDNNKEYDVILNKMKSLGLVSK